jgi:DNA replication protein DnaC
MKTELLLDYVTKELKLPTIREQYRSLAREAEAKNLSYEAYLLALLEQEQMTRETNQKQQRLRRATFPMQKTLDTFDFHLLPSLNVNRVLTLSKGEFVQKKEQLFLIGNCGTGKSHLAIALGISLIQEGYRVKFTTVANLVEELLVAKEEHNLLTLEKQWMKFDCVICDELGYIPFSKTGAELLFQFFSNRNERRSHIFTSNLVFDEWTQVFADEKLTAALLDRLTHRAHILLMNGESYRFRQSLQQIAEETKGERRT